MRLHLLKSVSRRILLLAVFSVMVVQCGGCKRQFLNASGYSSHVRAHPACDARHQPPSPPNEPSVSSFSDSHHDGGGGDDGSYDGDHDMWTHPSYWDEEEVRGQNLCSQQVVSKVHSWRCW
jgi:hypothetical protein